VRSEVCALLAYRRLGRGRLRMVLEAIEDHMRGWRRNHAGLANERVARAALAIEHVMPRKWMANWPISAGENAEQGRDRVIHMLGNLTLLTDKLNSRVSNGPWFGDNGKRTALEGHDILMLNRDLLKKGDTQWTEELIAGRTRDLAELILQIWPVPLGHKSGFTGDRPRPQRKLQLSDLIAAGVLSPGMSLYPRRKKFADHVATLLQDGSIELDNQRFPSASRAARALTGTSMNGWWFFLVDQVSKKSLRTVRRDYLNAMAVETEDDESDDDGDDDDE
jgi:Protein of unknown function (DUF1524)/Restriction Enzyme Adenine Methylase Associated